MRSAYVRVTGPDRRKCQKLDATYALSGHEALAVTYRYGVKLSVDITRDTNSMLSS